MPDPIKGDMQVTPEQLSLLKKHENQHRFTLHLQQETTNYVNEKSMRIFQKGIIGSAKDQLIDVNWQVGDMSLHFRGKYANLTKILEEAIERAEFKLKPLKAQHRQSSEIEDRIMNEFMAKGKENVNSKELSVGKKTQ